jgi:hypothetical protein
MVSLLVILLIVLAAVFLLSSRSEEHPTTKNKGEEQNERDWEYGDVWKQGSPDEPVPEDDIEYVAILRGETGMGYSDTTMQDFILYLGSEGIRAKYDSYPLEQTNIYVLKVEAEKVKEARDLLKTKFSGETKRQL